MLGKATPQIVTGSVPGPKAKELLKRRNEAVPKALCGTAYPICMAKGEGAMLEDADGNRFLDWIGGVGVLNIGYSRKVCPVYLLNRRQKYSRLTARLAAASSRVSCS